MNKEKEIIEMGEEIGRALGITYDGERLPFTMHTRSYLSKELIEAGYRKATEKEQEEERREEEIMSLTAQVEVLQSEKDNLLRTLEETGEKLRDIRKETAKEILEYLREVQEKDEFGNADLDFMAVRIFYDGNADRNNQFMILAQDRIKELAQAYEICIEEEK